MTAQPNLTPWVYIGPEGHRARPAVRFVDHGMTDDERAKLLHALTHLPRLVRARTQKLEAAGRGVLEARSEDPAKRPWVVRYHYESMAGEKLAAEFGGLTEAEAATHAVGRDAITYAVKRPRDTKCTGLVESDALAKSYPAAVGTCSAETWCTCRGSGWVESPIPALRKGYRMVIFPSEIKP